MSIINRFRGKYSFLSNFAAADVELDGKIYRTVEHAYQAAKTCDPFIRFEIRTQPTPADARRLGRKVKLRDDWESRRLQVMRDLLYKKFQRADLKELLLSTGDSELVEGNYWHDNYWGSCECFKCSTCLHQNHLGKLLMEVRTQLRRSTNG